MKADVSYTVVVEPLGDVIEVLPGQTILDAALRSGLALPHRCSQGICSACKIGVLEGVVDVGDVSGFALLDSERQEDKCLACRAVPQSDLVIEVDIAPDVDAKRYPVRDFQAVVTSIKELSPSIKSIFLALGDEGIQFQSGQYIHLEIPGLHGPGERRAFSIASPPSSSNVIELNVALVEGGRGTAYLHNELRVGDVLSFSGPYGQFFLRPSLPEPIIFLAADSGLSGVKSMVMELMESNDPHGVTLIFGAHSEEEVYYRDLFEQYARECDNFTFLSTLGDGGQAGEDWSCVHECASEYFGGAFEGYNAYVCGPPKMVDACVSVLMSGRCFERHIFFEKFYNSGNRAQPPRVSAVFKSM